MPNSELSIQCSNPHCKNYNNLDNLFCQKCKTPIVKRYLWAVGEESYSEIEAYKTTNSTNNQEAVVTELELLDSQYSTKNLDTQATISVEDKRYFHIGDRIFLDTQPTEIPQIPEQLPPEIVNHLQLFSWFPHIPQVYGQLDGTNTWLLDYGSVPIDQKGKLVFDDLIPQMDSLWLEASPLKQINWLRQIASLWQPLQDKGMVATLLNPELIRVNGGFIQLLELKTDTEYQGNLKDLGKLWQQWAQKAHIAIKDVLIQLSDRMATGSINRIKHIIKILNRTLELYAASQKYTYKVFALTDSGPKRRNNQDTAYPDSETLITANASESSLAIICDGVGGHEGGEIASLETVNYLRKSISQMQWDKNNPNIIFKKLVQFVNEANDLVSQRNDSEERTEKQRMGTTLVMSLLRNHEAYITHVGDSRVYLITRNSCHQITTDDDLASREVRLGYAVYQNALRYPSAGALIQAIGMRDSTSLHPNIKRLVIDEECLFLLCSDGLSDFDRVEQYWRSIVLPVLDSRISLEKAVQTLIKVGNKKNGHDNITAALVHCQIKESPPDTSIAITWDDIEATFGGLLIWTDEIIADDLSTTANTAEHSEGSDSVPEVTKTTKLPNKNRTAKTKSKLIFLSTMMSLSVLIVISLYFLIYASTKNQNDSQNDSWRSFMPLKSRNALDT